MDRNLKYLTSSVIVFKELTIVIVPVGVNESYGNVGKTSSNACKLGPRPIFQVQVTQIFKFRLLTRLSIASRTPQQRTDPGTDRNRSKTRLGIPRNQVEKPRKRH